MANFYRRSTRDYIYREHSVSAAGRAVLNEDIHYNDKLTKMIDIYGEYFLTGFESKVDELTEMFYAERYIVDGEVDKQAYDKFREITQREFKESCLTSLAYQVKALPVINFTKCSKLERHIVVALGDLRKTHTQEYQRKIEDYSWETRKQSFMVKDLEKSVIEHYAENKQTKAAAKDCGMER